MTALQTRQLEMLTRVQAFGQIHAGTVPERSVGAQAFAAIATAIRHLSEQAVSQRVATRDGQSAQVRARAALVAQLDAISRTARVLARQRPGFDEAFRRPKTRSDQALLATGRAVAQEAAVFRDQFVGHGMPATFIDELGAGIDALAQATRHRDANRNGQAAARVTIKAAVASGIEAVRTLDVVLANQLRDDAATMAMWERSRRVEYPRRTRKLVPIVPTPAVPPSPAEPRRPDGAGKEAEL